MLNTDEIKDIVPNPADIVKKLDAYVVGQSKAKKALSQMLFRRSLVALQNNHRLRMLNEEAQLEKLNVLLIGQSGSGKTHLLKTVAKTMDVPIVFYDVTEITSAGYVGSKVEDIILNLVLSQEDWVDANYHSFIEKLGCDPEEALYCYSKTDVLMDRIENGIVYLDEIDKIRAHDTSGLDIGGDCVQNELLKLLENGIVNLKNASNKTRSRYGVESVDTKNISFVCGGAFKGLTDLVKDRKKEKSGIGFSSTLVASNDDAYYNDIDTEDLISYGFKKEFIGRLQVRACLNKISVDDLIKIIREPKNNLIDQYKNLFFQFGIGLTFTSEAVVALATHAVKLKTGARSLPQIFIKLFAKELYDIHNTTKHHLVIDRVYVKDALDE